MLNKASAVICIATLSVVMAPAACAEEEFELAIGAQSIADAVRELSFQTKRSVLYQTDQLGTVQTTAIDGKYSLEEALDVLLQGTGLQGDLTESGMIVVSLEKGASAPRREETGMNNRTTRSLMAGFSALVFGSGAQGAALAQDAPETDEVQRQDTVFVTATRREASIQDTPLSVTAITPAEIERQGIENFSDFAAQVPGVVLSEPVELISKFTIRGLTTSTTSSSIGEQKAVAVYLDDVPVTSFSIITPDVLLDDVERVEVLRGPQGTLFGSGALAGAVRIISAKPDLSQFDASVGVDFGLTDGDALSRRYNAMVNIPLVDDKVGVRASGFLRDRDGYIDNIFLEQDDVNSSLDWGGRLSLRARPTDRLTLTLLGMHSTSELDDTSAFQPSLGTNKTAVFQPVDIVAEVTSLNATAEYEFDWATLVGSSTYAKTDNDWVVPLDQVLTGVLRFAFGEEVSQDAFAHEVRLVSETDGPLEWVIGGFYMDRESDYESGAFTLTAFAEGLNITGLPISGINPGTALSQEISLLENSEVAAFGEVSYSLPQDLTLTVGARYAETEFVDTLTGRGFDSIAPFIGAVFAGGNIDLVPAAVAPASLSTGETSNVTTKFVLSWEPTDDQTYYISASEGFRRPHPNGAALANGGVSSVDPSDPTVIPLIAESDSLWNYELGAKLSFMDGRLSTNLVGYFITWEDIQAALTRPSDSVPFVGNLGKAESYGFEGELLARPNDQLEFGLNLTLQNAEIVELTEQEALTSGAIIGSPLASPDVQVSGFLQYTWPLSQGQEIYGRLDVQHVGSYPNGFPNLPGVIAPNPAFATISSYENVNVSAGWTTNQWDLVVYAENLLDNDDFIAINPSTSSFSNTRTLRPQTFGVRAIWNFN
ncbi:MAG: TonB-dependent receptor [Pseudomonadota bacterium]